MWSGADTGTELLGIEDGNISILAQLAGRGGMHGACIPTYIYTLLGRLPLFSIVGRSDLLTVSNPAVFRIVYTLYYDY